MRAGALGCPFTALFVASFKQGTPHAALWSLALGPIIQPSHTAQPFAPTVLLLRRRKKDHGRAEALVLAAYALGVRMQPLGGSKADGAAADDDDEEPGQGSDSGEEEEAEE